MKYIVQIEIDPDVGSGLEDNPKVIQDLIGRWQARKPVGMYFSLTRRSMTIVLDAASEDVFFEALHATWRITHSYPAVYPVASLEEFPALLKRAGISG